MKAESFALMLAGLSSASALPSKAPPADTKMAVREMSNADGQPIQLLVRDSLVENAPVSKRQITFPAVAFDGNKCGDSTFQITPDVCCGKATLAPNLDDCQNLVSGLRAIDQHWSLNNGFGGFSKKWIKLAAVDTCHFYVNRKDFVEATTDAAVLIGVEDVADVIESANAKFQSPGKVTWPGGGMDIGVFILPGCAMEDPETGP
ncbi:hypothetical protein FALBO_4709 [Fusarium albosuccineum]|uniref:Ecp2 effector protein-like domain-containing protein n=1 Tax=Fusarium albosuccineum TaxID=1237068 RepID=A0A8H4PAH9_9HYPO|nr:hypothetical protein FALBO_4709 [Fusarium albosuccineum]